MTTPLIIPEAMRGDVKLIRHIGDVWGKFKVNVKDSASAHSLREVEIFLGCLKNNWKLSSSLNTEEIPWSCTTGMFTLPKDKSYKVSIGTRNLPPMLQAAMLGQKITSYFTGTSESVLVREKITLTAGSFTTDGYGLDLSDSIIGLTYDDVVKIISVRRKSNGTWWSNALVAENDNNEFKFIEGDSGVMGLDEEPLIQFEDNSFSGEEFIVTVEYERVMTDGEFKLIEDGVTFPEAVDFYLNWLVKVETGPNRGRKGGLIAIAKNCQRSGDMEIGGDSQGITSQTLEFSVNFEDEGDLELHFSWID